MVSQGSFCDSDGVPGFMQEASDEDAVVEISSSREYEDYPILVAGERVIPSSSGGINVLEDACSEKSEPLSPEAAKKWVIEQEALKASALVKEFDADCEIKDSVRVSNLEKFLKAKGFSLEEVEKFSQLENLGYSGGNLNRDEFGLHKFPKSNVEGTGRKSSTVSTSGVKNSQGK